MDEELLQEFLVEAGERIETLHADLAHLRRVHATDGRARRELLARIFRHVHTLKGAAATVRNLEAVTELAHEFESLLDDIRSGRTPLTEATLDAGADALDAFTLLLATAARGDTPRLPPGIVSRLRQQATGLVQTPVEEPPAPTADAILAALPAEITDALSQTERHRLSESVAEGGRVLLVNVAFDLDALDDQFKRCADALGECGEIISTFPADPPSSAPDRISFRFLYTTVCAHAELEPRLVRCGAGIVRMRDEPATKAAPASRRAEATSASREVLLHGSREEITNHAPVELLSQLTDDARMADVSLAPLRAVLERAAHVGRVAARAAGKETECEVVCDDDVRLGRRRATHLNESLLHLVRNAVDHGIETPEERRAAGKPERGRVRLEGSLEQHSSSSSSSSGGAAACVVVVRVADDGRGIDVERVARVAVARGWWEAGVELSANEAVSLICRPGFSTAAEVSMLSGRGVGLDIVRQALESAGGAWRVQTTRGQGTTFELWLPLDETLRLASAPLL